MMPADYELAAMLPRLDTAIDALGAVASAGDGVLSLDATDLLAGYAAGETSPPAVVRAVLARIDSLDPSIGAIWARDASAALTAAERSAARWRVGRTRLLEGVPIVIKDLLDTADLATTGGSQWLADRRPTADAAVVAAVRAAGAIVIGKSATFELGCGNEDIPFGTVRNPWNLGHTTGGSSAGSAAALAARYVPLAIGTDTGGSIRIPASYCGVVGLKPTLGRLSNAGLVGLAPTLDTAGPMARTARDVALLFSVIAAVVSAVTPGGSSQPITRVGVPRPWFFDVVDDEVRAAVDMAIETLGASGISIVEIDVAHAEHGATLSWLITMYEAAQTYRDAPRELLSPSFVSRLEVGERITAASYRAALDARSRLTAAVSGVFDRCDALLMPSTVSTAPPLDDVDRAVAGVDGNWPDVLARTVAIWNVTGLPALSVPIALDRTGLPIGIQLVGPAHSDERLLHFAAHLERPPALPPQRTVI
ncbi:MAG: amidase [Ilumatobacteraceae bacterium]